MNHAPRICWIFGQILIALLVFAQTSGAQKERTQGAPETTRPRLQLRWERPAYRSFALDPYSNYPNHSVPSRGLRTDGQLPDHGV